MPGERVLIVDDDPRILEVLRTALREAGFTVAIERNGERAVNAFLYLPTRFVILDALLPIANGFDIAAKIRSSEAGAEVPILFMSGVYRSRKLRTDAARKYGAVAFLDKPVLPSQIVAIVREALAPEMGAGAADEPTEIDTDAIRALEAELARLGHPAAPTRRAAEGERLAAPVESPEPRAAPPPPLPHAGASLFDPEPPAPATNVLRDAPRPQIDAPPPAAARPPPPVDAPSPRPDEVPMHAEEPRPGWTIPEVPQAAHGRLEDRPFPEVLGPLCHARATGALELRRDRIRKVVYLRDGFPIDVQSNRVEECLGRLLLREGLIREDDLDRSFDLMKETGRRQGQVLVDMGAVQPDLLQLALRIQLSTKLHEVFSWRGGEWRWHPGSKVPSPTAVLSVPALALVYDGLRRAWDEGRARAALHGAERLRRKAFDPAWLAGLASLEHEFVEALPGARVEVENVFSPSEVTEAAPVARADAWRLLYALYCVGMVEAAPETDSAEEIPEAELVDTAGEAAADDPPSDSLAPAQFPNGDARVAALGAQDIYRQLVETLARLKGREWSEVLGVATDAPPAEIRRAYQALCREFHPDRRFAAAPEELRVVAAEIYEVVRSAYESLSR